jgi:ATP-dependent Clp protease ATP-binding subunit ClpA
MVHGEAEAFDFAFDEIEKALTRPAVVAGHPRQGNLTLGDNRRVDLSQCIIIMTSNLVPRNQSADGDLVCSESG